MAANARNLERGEEKRSIVADESALLALAAEKESLLPPSLGDGHGWGGILRGIVASQHPAATLRAEPGFFSHAPIIPRMDETTVDDNPLSACVSGAYCRNPEVGDQILVSAVTATYGRSVLSLTSHGELIELVALEGSAGVVGMAGEQEIFRLLFRSDGTYLYSQSGPLDHAIAGDPDDALNLFFSFSVNGQDSHAAMIQVHDDAPVAQAIDSGVVLDESASHDQTAMVSLDFGTDGPAAVGNAPVTITAFHGEVGGEPLVLASHGVAVSLRPVAGDPGAVEGWAGESRVFRFTLNSEGEEQLVLYQPLDHPDGTDPDDELQIVFDLVIKDFDGDSAAASVAVAVRDDAPLADASAEVVYPDLAGGMDGIYEQDGVGRHPAITGQFNHDFGFDGQALLAGGQAGFVITGASTRWETGSGALTSSGEPLTFVRDALDSNLFHGMAHGEEILRLGFDTSLQTFTYTQLGGLDHPEPGNSSEVMDLLFDIALIDADGDTVSSQLCVSGIHDGAPVAVHDSDVVSLQNGDGTGPGVTCGNLVSGLDPDPSGFGLIGNQYRDSPGSDEMVIRAITHAGYTYTLSADNGSVVSPDGGSAMLAFEQESGKLTLRSGLGGLFCIDMVGEELGQYSYTAPESLSLGTSYTMTPTQTDLLPGMSLAYQADQGWLLDLGGRIADSVELVGADGMFCSAYRFGEQVDTLAVVNTAGALLVKAPSSGEADDTYQVPDLDYALEDQSFYHLQGTGEYDYSWSKLFTVSWDESISVGGIAGSLTTTPAYNIETVLGTVHIPAVVIDTRTGLAATIWTTGELGVRIGLDYNDFNYDTNIGLCASLTPPDSLDPDNYYGFATTSQIESQSVALGTASWSAWMDLILTFDIGGSYEARVPYYGTSGSGSTPHLEWDPQMLLIGMDPDGINASLFGYPVLDGLGGVVEGGGGDGSLLSPDNFAVTYNPLDPDAIESVEIDLPGPLGKVSEEGGLTAYPEYGTLTLYNFTDLLPDAASSLTDGVIEVSSESPVLGVDLDLTTLAGLIVFGNPLAFGGKVEYGKLAVNYDAIEVDMESVFSVGQSLALEPTLMANLQFSQPVEVDGLVQPVRVLNGVEWDHLPGIRPVGDEPVVVTPSFYLSVAASAEAVAELSLEWDVNIGRFDLGLNLMTGVSYTLADVGPIYQASDEVAEWQCGSLWGNDYTLVTDPLTGKGSFLFPSAPNPVPDAGMDQLLLGSNDFEQLTVHFDPGCLGREFFSYTLEDADGDASTANLAITVTAEAALPDQITLSHTLVAENSADGTVIANLAAYAGSFSLFQIYGDGGTFALTEDAGGRFAINAADQLVVAGPLDYESASWHELGVLVTDPDGQSHEQYFTIGVEDLNDMPQFTTPWPLLVEENRTGVVSMVTAEDQEGDILTYALTSWESTGLTLDPVTGELWLSRAFDYEEHSSYQISVMVTDQAGGVTERDYQLNVVDINEAPTQVTLSNISLSLAGLQENPLIGTLSAIDPEKETALSYTLIGDDNGRFMLVGNELQLASGATLQPGENPAITVRVADSGGSSTDQAFSLHVVTADNIFTLQSSGTLTLPYAALLFNDAYGDFTPLTVLPPLGVANPIEFAANSLSLDLTADYPGFALGNDPVLFEYGISDGSQRIESSAVIYQGTLSGDLAGLEGTGGDEILIGTMAGETLSGAAGKDVLIGAGGEDTLLGGDGDDLLLLADTEVARVDGGGGFDCLGLLGDDLPLDLTDSALADRFSGIEMIDMRGSGDNRLSLDGDAVLQISDLLSDGADTAGLLFVLGDLPMTEPEGGTNIAREGDEVLLAGAWSLQSDQSDGSYYAYELSGVDITLMIQSELRVVLSEVA